METLRDPISVLPTGIPALDEALGLRGWPCGTIVEVFGPRPDTNMSMPDAYLGRLGRLGIAAQSVRASLACTRGHEMPGWIDLENAWPMDETAIDGSRLFIEQPVSPLGMVQALDRFVIQEERPLVVVNSLMELNFLGDSDAERVAMQHLSQLSALLKGGRSRSVLMFLGGPDGSVISRPAFASAVKLLSSIRISADCRGRGRVMKNIYETPFQKFRIN